MKDKYAIENLITGNMLIVHSYSENGPTREISKVVFIVEKINSRFNKIFSKIKKYYYAEIFTEFKIKLEKDTIKDGFDCKDFEVPYLVNLGSIGKYLSEAERKSGHISRIRLMEIYNYLNFEAMIKGD